MIDKSKEIGKEYLAAWEKMDPTQRMLSQCESDPWLFAINAIETFDEQEKEWSKFPDFPYLADVFTKIEADGDKYWLKSQRMLITISFCIYFLHSFLYGIGFNGFLTSKVEGSIDNIKAGWNSLFGKIRAMFDRLPDVLVEAALGRRYHSSELFNYMAATNPKNGNVIVGHAPTVACGLGEGYTIAFVDECAAVFNMNMIHTNLTQSCRGNKNYVSFPLGQGNKFFEIHDKDTHFGFEKVEIHHSLNPRYDAKWRAEQEVKMTAFEIAQRLDMSFEESTSGKVWKKFSRVLSVKPTDWIAGLPIFLWWDFGFQDFTSVGFIQVAGQSIRAFDWLEENHSNYRDISKDLRAKLEQYGINFAETGVDSEGFKTYRCVGDIRSVGDPQVKAGEISSGLNLQTKYGEQGFMIEACDVHNSIMILDKIDDEFSQGHIVMDSRCEPFIDSCQYWAWPSDSRGNAKPGVTQPAHSKHSHAGKAFEYGFTMMRKNVILHSAVREQDPRSVPFTAGLATREF